MCLPQYLPGDPTPSEHLGTFGDIFLTGRWCCGAGVPLDRGHGCCETAFIAQDPSLKWRVMWSEMSGVCLRNPGHRTCFICRVLIFWVSEHLFSSVAQSCPTLWPHESQHARPLCPSPTPEVHSDSCSSSLWCHPAIYIIYKEMLLIHKKEWNNAIT